MVTPCPAVVVVLAARRLLVVSVAESTDTELLEVDDAAACALGGTSPPAMTVTADATVCIVLPVAAIGPSWKLGAAGALMGNEPAGHMQRQLQPPLLAACSALTAAVLLLPEPATTVTAAPALDVVVAPMRASLVSVAVFTVLVEVEAGGAVVALMAPDPEPATTVTALPLAAAWVAEETRLEIELLLPPEPEPACTVTVAFAAVAPTLVNRELLDRVELLPDPGCTVKAAATIPLDDF